jgi:homocysteine S-methyltransferase
VNLDFLAAGADCIATATYQASLTGLRRRGLSDAEAIDVLRQSVRLAVEARDEFWAEPSNREGRLRPLVQASIGPYGAYLADGSEYTGDYDIDEEELYEFHRSRWHLLAESDVDLLACETIPSRPEADVLLRLLRETPARWAWLSFSCRDGSHLCDGSRLVDVARACDAEPGVAAVGVNCIAPEHAPDLIAEALRGTAKPILVYPNSGEAYDAGTKTWSAGPSSVDWADAAAQWVRSGAGGVGGCCRVGPATIAEMRRRLVS